MNFYGTPRARLHRNDSIYKNLGPRRSPFVNVMSMLLLFAPEAHINALNDVTVDGIISVTHLKPLFASLIKEWQDLLLLVSSYDSYILTSARVIGDLINEAGRGIIGCRRLLSRNPIGGYRPVSCHIEVAPTNRELSLNHFHDMFPGYWVLALVAKPYHIQREFS